jgi:glyoxylase-like metal-dependent hydrolase (beta-lactamase superfamily II)
MRIGEIELVPVLDAVGTLPLEVVYPDVPLEAWKPYREPYFQLFDGDGWHPPITCYLLKAGGQTILVDTGLGEFELFDSMDVSGGLLPALAAEGFAADQVDTVFITHLHVDHFGWNTAFANARFVMHKDAVAVAPERADRPHVAQGILPLIEAGRVERVEDGAELAPGVIVAELPGHDPGHSGLRLGSEAIVIADAAGHPAFFDRPEWLLVADLDEARTVATRKALLEEVVDTDTLVICGHYPGSGIGRVTRTAGGRVLWQEVPSA